MRWMLPLAVLGAALIALVATPDDQLIIGLDHGRFAQVATGAALGLWLLTSAARWAGGGAIARSVGNALVWATLLIGLVGAYAYRFEFSDFADRVVAELVPMDPVVGQGGEVSILRRLSGEFVVSARVNNQPTTFLFDTGASSVVLRAEDARRMGVDTANLTYSVRVTTANGSALAAETVLDRVSVGPIVVRNVRALIARPGSLGENLLGMTFLDRLKSFSVERGRLTLLGGDSARLDQQR
jgi:aspartyl protease family protein